MTKSTSLHASRSDYSHENDWTALPSSPPGTAHLERLVRDGQRAHVRFIQCNLKLVVSVAKRYAGRGVPLIDLIQDGNLGLDRAVKKFDHAKGYRFSTYAVWWIRQSIVHGLADNSRVILVPVHAAEKINRLRRLERQLGSEFGRLPSETELAEVANLSCVEVHQLFTADRTLVSLHARQIELGALVELRTGELHDYL